MNSRYGKLVALCVTCLCVLAAERASWAQGYTPYTNPAGGFTILYPGNWEQRMVGTTLVALSPQESPTDTFRENVNVVFENLPMPMPATQYALLSSQAMQSQLNSYMPVEQGAAMVGGQQAYYIVYQHFMNQNIMVLAYFIVRGNRGYVITCSASPGDLMRYRAIFTQVANTIRFP